MLNVTSIHPLTAAFAINMKGDSPEVLLTHRVRRARRFTVARLARPVAVFFRRWALRARLEGLDDRLLDDIGIARKDISAVVACAHPWTSKPKLVTTKVALHTTVVSPVAANDTATAVRVA